MLKSSLIFRRNRAHLFKKKTFEKTNIVHFQGLSVLNMQKHFLFVSKFEHGNFEINRKYSKKDYDNPNYYVSLVIFQACGFKECPLTWVAPLTTFLPIKLINAINFWLLLQLMGHTSKMKILLQIISCKLVIKVTQMYLFLKIIAKLIRVSYM
jgi:hypothetical protein